MSWRRRARVDANHAEIVKGLRAAGCTVVSLATIGRGCPDLLVGVSGRWILLEVKRPELSDHRPDNLAESIRLRDQAEWRSRARGPVAVVYDAGEALAVVGLTAPAPGSAFTPGAVAARRARRR